MKVRVVTLSILPLLAITAQAAAAPPVRITASFDRDWRFLKADAPGAEKPAFDDTNWRTLDVPHDWSIEGPFDQKNPTGGAGVSCRRVWAGTASASRSRPTNLPAASSSNSTA